MQKIKVKDLVVGQKIRIYWMGYNDWVTVENISRDDFTEWNIRVDFLPELKGGFSKFFDKGELEIDADWQEKEAKDFAVGDRFVFMNYDVKATSNDSTEAIATEKGFVTIVNVTQHCDSVTLTINNSDCPYNYFKTAKRYWLPPKKKEFMLSEMDIKKVAEVLGIVTKETIIKLLISTDSSLSDAFAEINKDVAAIAISRNIPYNRVKINKVSVEVIEEITKPLETIKKEVLKRLGNN